MSSRSLLLPSALACWATLAMLACPGGQSGDEGNNRSAASDGNGSSTLLPFCSYSDDNGPDVRRRRHVCVSRDPGYTSGMLRWPAGHTPPGPYGCTCDDDTVSPEGRRVPVEIA